VVDVAVPDGLLDRAALDALPGDELVVTPWRSLVVVVRPVDR